MARIDRLIQTLHEQRADQAHMTPGKPVMILQDGAAQPLSARMLSRDQIVELVQEIIPPSHGAFQPGQQLGFVYECEHGAVELSADWTHLGLQVTLQRPTGAQALSAPVLEPMTGELGVSLSSPSEPARRPLTTPSLGFAASPSTGVRTALASAPEPTPASAPPSPSPSAIPTSPSPSPSPSLGLQAAQGPGRRHPFVGEGKPAEINKYLNLMFQEGCSDLHLSSLNPPLYRKDGDIVHLRNLPRMMPEEVEALIYPIMPDRNYREFQEHWDTDFAHEIPGVGRFRVNCFMDRMGPGAVMRIIPSDILTAEALNLPKAVLDLCWLNKGLVVVTGPTGSGKSTTLAAIIDYINRNRACHIITIEDPIEFVHPNKKCLLNQREVGLHTKSFKNALRAALREDPDIVLVGEMRDLETIAIAIETAETGHLVFGTLHTNTAPSTVDRIIDQFPADRQAQIRTMLSESLKAVIAQTLCKKAQGGRIAALEILLCTHAISNLIREGKTFQIASMMSTSKGAGMVTINDSLLELVQKRVITAEEAYIKAIDKSSLKAAMERAGIRLNMPTAQA